MGCLPTTMRKTIRLGPNRNPCTCHLAMAASRLVDSRLLHPSSQRRLRCAPFGHPRTNRRRGMVVKMMKMTPASCGRMQNWKGHRLEHLLERGSQTRQMQVRSSRLVEQKRTILCRRRRRRAAHDPISKKGRVSKDVRPKAHLFPILFGGPGVVLFSNGHRWVFSVAPFRAIRSHKLEKLGVASSLHLGQLIW